MHETKLEKLTYLFLFSLAIIFILCFSSMSILNFIKLENTFYFLSLIFFIALVLVLPHFIFKDSSTRTKILFIFFISFALRSVIAIFFDAIPFSDFAVYLNSANSLASNNITSLTTDLYYKNFPELFGFIIWESILIKIFGYNLVSLRLVNCFISALTCILIYIIGKKYNDKVGFIAAFIYAIYPSQILMTSVFTNQHFATLLYLIAIVLIQYKVVYNTEIKLRFIWCSLIGVIIGIANIIRPIAPPILLAIIFYFLLNIINALYFKNKSKLKLNLVTILIPIFFVITGKLYYMGIYNYGLTDQMFPSSDIRYKFAVGLNLESNGQYSDIIANEFWNGNDSDREKLFNESINNIISNPGSGIKLTLNKMNSLFSKSDASFYWLTGQNKVELGTKSSILDTCEKIYIVTDTLFLSLLYIFATIGLFLIYKLEDKNFSKLLVWIFLGYVGVHCLIEIQSRYRYFLIPIITIFSSYGMNYLFNYTKNFRNSKINL
ncbi:glycosyltransferase family 39 protein [Paraclostridium sordellii]|uniref:glycosyltransferase family 39 protein n=1 Tax=Paraclostridium sordellii TaxID=1505 RepID=UPI0005DFE216|nr:glycosyltransferase family 39 protein [Paeniclostridium sordellii]CEP81537.1 integral membrane protein [[Clostridium] sordellii] [Paeniclostridium sordellii]